MDNHESPTYYRSIALGRGREVSDDDFYAYVEGLTSEIDEDVLTHLSAVLSKEPWLKEVEEYRRELTSDRLEVELDGAQTALAAVLAKRLATLPRRESPGSGSSMSTRSATNIPKPSDVLRRLMDQLQQALAPGAISISGATRSSSTDIAGEIESDLAKLEDTLRLREKGLSVASVRAGVRKLLTENREQQKKLNELKQLLQQIHQAILTILDDSASQ